MKQQVFFYARVVTAISVAILGIGAMPVAAVEEVGDVTPRLAETPALVRDAEEYALEFGVPVDEALRRLELQGVVGDIGAEIEKSQPETYAGHWIEHEPIFRVVFATSGDAADLDKQLADTAIADVSVVQTVGHSLGELLQIREQLTSRVKDVDFKTNIDIKSNVVEVYAADADAFRSGASSELIRLGESVRVIERPLIARTATTMYAGRKLWWDNGVIASVCTSGYVVVPDIFGPAQPGLTTAGHCRNNMEWWATGEPLTFVAQITSGPHDEQWMLPPSNATLKPWAAESSSEYRLITAKRSYQNQSVGDFVCHYGINTHYGCGNIHSKFGPSCTSSDTLHIWVRNNGGADMSDGGDSGGPWYAGGTALGLMSCEYIFEPNSDDGPDAGYVAINRVESGLDVVVLLAP